MNSLQPKVRVLLDVDGCVNAVPPDYSRLAHMWGVIREVSGVNPKGLHPGFRITFTPTWGEFFNELISQGVDVNWLTTWREDANVWISPLLDMPQDLPVLGTDIVQTRSGVFLITTDRDWWKHECAEALWNAEHIPFVWIDDDFDENPEAVEWAESLGDDCLIIHPYTEVGITLDHMEEIRGFVQRHTT